MSGQANNGILRKRFQIRRRWRLVNEAATIYGALEERRKLSAHLRRDSFPWNNLLRLDLWRKVMNIARIMLRKIQAGYC